MQYKVSFLLALVGSFLSCVTEFGVVLVLFSRIQLLAGWALAEVALLYGLSGTCFAVAELFAAALDNFQTYIVRGTFDRVLARPRGALLQVIAEDFELRQRGRPGSGAAERQHHLLRDLRSRCDVLLLDRPGQGSHACFYVWRRRRGELSAGYLSRQRAALLHLRRAAGVRQLRARALFARPRGSEERRVGKEC